MHSDDGDVSEEGIEEDIEEEICDSSTHDDNLRYPRAKLLSFSADPSSHHFTFSEELASSVPESIPSAPGSNVLVFWGNTEKVKEEGEVVHQEVGCSFQAEQSSIYKTKCFLDIGDQEIHSSPSPVLSDKSGASSGKSQGDVARDRSVSEVYVSVPKVSVLPFHSTRQVSKLVHQFSVQSEDGASRESYQEEGMARRRSLPSWFPPGNSSPTKRIPFTSLQLQAANNPLALEEVQQPSKISVSGMVDLFSSSADRFEFLPDKRSRVSPRKLSSFSPEFKASLEKIGTCLSRGSSYDSHFNTEDGKVVKSLEMVETQEPSKRGGRVLHRAQKENSPRRRAKPVLKIKEERDCTSGRAKGSCESSPSSSLCHSSASITSKKSRRTASQNVTLNRLVAGQSSGGEIESNIIKLAFEGMCDTEEEVEDMPEEREYSVGSEVWEGCQILESTDVSERNLVSERNQCSKNSSVCETSERIEISEVPVCEDGERRKYAENESSETTGSYKRTEESLNSTSNTSDRCRKRVESEGSERSSRVARDGNEKSGSNSSVRKSDGSVSSANGSSNFESERGEVSSSETKSESSESNSVARSEGSGRSTISRVETEDSERSVISSSKGTSEDSENISRLRSEGSERNAISRTQIKNECSNKDSYMSIRSRPSWKDTVSSDHCQQSISLVTTDEARKSEISVSESFTLRSQRLIPGGQKGSLKHDEVQGDSVRLCSIPSKVGSDNVDLTWKLVEDAAIGQVQPSMDATRFSFVDQSGGAQGAHSEDNQQQQDDSVVDHLSQEENMSSHFNPGNIMPSNVSQDTEEYSCEDKLSMSIEELMGNDCYSSDNSEIILGLVNTSPISAITERTEESTQDHEQLASASKSKGEEADQENNEESESSVSEDHNDVDTGNAGFVGGSCVSLPLHVASEEAIQSPVLGGSLVQTCVSLEVPNEKLSSQSKPKMKPKMPVLSGGLKGIGRTTTPPLSPLNKNSSGGLRASLQRHTSRSLHNLASHPRTALRGHGLSVSSDDLQAGGERINHLPPRHNHPRVKGRFSHSPDTLDSRLSRRCVSAVTLNEGGVGRGVGKCLRSSSLGGLNRSRSSSLSSVTSIRRPDYSHVGSKVKQYIKEMKERDLKNTTRSLPTTPPSRPAYGRSSPHVMILDEPLLKDLSQYSLDDTPEDLKKLREKLVGEKADPKMLEEILELLVKERKSRCAADRTLAALQLRFDNMTAMFAEKQNEIDRLRFYKDVKVNEEFTVTLKTKEEETGRSRRPSVGGTSVASFRHSPSSSALATPSQSPCRSPTPCNLIRATSTPIANPNITLALEHSSSLISPSVSVNHSAHDVSQSDLDVTLPDTHLTCPEPNLTECCTDLTLPGPDLNLPSTELIQPGIELTHPDPSLTRQGRDQSRSCIDLTQSVPDLEKIPDKRGSTPDERVELGRTVDSGVVDSIQEDATLDSWMKDAEVILQRVKEFAVLEENKVLNQKERTIIWHSILEQYWSVCSQFPVVSTHWSTPQSGLVLQELGQAIQVLATRYSLDLLPQGQSELTPLSSSPSEVKKTGDHPSSETFKAGGHITGEEVKTYSHNGGASNTTDVKYGSHSGTSHKFVDEVGEKTCEDSRNVVDCSPKCRSHSCPGHRDTGEVGQKEVHIARDVGVSWSHRGHSSGQNTGVKADILSLENVGGGTKGRSDGFIDTLPLTCKTSKSVQQLDNIKEDAKNVKVPGKSSEATGYKVSEEVAVSEIRKMENSSDDRKNVSQSEKRVIDDFSRGKSRASENKTKVLDKITKIPGTSGEGEEREQKGKQSTVEATFSPAHSRESMKTVGPLEKVKLWQESLIDPDLPPPVSPSHTMSPVSSLLSLNSSQPFDLSPGPPTTPQPLSPSHQLPQYGATHNSNAMQGQRDIPEDDCPLTDLPQASPLHTNSPLDSSCRGNELLVKPLQVDSSPKVSPTCRSAISSQVRPESDLPKSSWRSSTGTPRQSQSRLVKGRDVDSGCPGSEPSTRLSHNPSLDHPEWGHGNLAPAEGNQAEEGLLPLSKPDALLSEVASSLHREGSGITLSTHNTTTATHTSSGLCNSQNRSSITRSDTFASTVIRDSEVNDVSPSSDLVTIAFPKSETKGSRKVSENSGKDIKQNRALSIGRASSGYRQDLSMELQMGKCRQEDAEECDLTQGHDSEISGDWKGNGNTAVIYENIISPRELKSQAKEGRNRNQTKTPSPSSRHRGKSPTKYSMFDTPAKKQNKDQNRERYMSGNISNNSTISQSTSADIYNNISRLKRDLNYIKSQMMNLTTTGLHDRRTRDHPRKNSQSLISKSQGRQGPMKALDTSLLSEYDCDSSSSLTPPFTRNQILFSSRRSPNIRRPQSTESFDSSYEAHHGIHRTSVANSFHSKKGEKYHWFDSPDIRMEDLPAGTPKRRRSRSRELEEQSHTVSLGSGCKRKENVKHSRSNFENRNEERNQVTEMEETERKELGKQRRGGVGGRVNFEGESKKRWDSKVEEKISRRERGCRERNRWDEGSAHIACRRRSRQDNWYSSESEEETYHEQCGGRRLDYNIDSEGKSRTDRKQTFDIQREDRVSFYSCSPRCSPQRDMIHMSVRQAWTQTGEEDCTPRVPKLWNTDQEMERHCPDVKDQGSQARPLQYTKPLSSSSPIIYIQNYNCTSEACGAEGDSNNSPHFWSPQHRRSGNNTDEHTHRKKACSYELLDASISKATAIAEKLRLNSHRLLAHLTVHLQMPSSAVSSPGPVIAVHTPAVSIHTTPATTHTPPPVTHTPAPPVSFTTVIKSPPPPISSQSSHACSPAPPSSSIPLPLPSSTTSPVPSPTPQT